MVLVSTPRFYEWWHKDAIWAGEVMRPLFDWIQEERMNSKSH